MRILKLSGNKTMQTINFNSSGLNLILGNKTTDSAEKTVNGIGKTLSLKLIDFCLGSNDINELRNLEDWRFTLEICTNDKYKDIIDRDIINGESKKIYLNNQKYSLKDFNEYMYNTNFKVFNEIPEITFRNSISRFLRVPKKSSESSYNSWDIFKNKQQPEVALLINSYLLNLSPELVSTKIRLKKKLDSLKKTLLTINSDDNLKNIIQGTDINIAENSLSADIMKLDFKIDNFKISEEYNEIKFRSESLKEDKNNILNSICSLENLLKNIDKNLDVSIDISYDRVKKIYEDLNIIFSKNIVKSLDEVCDFHTQLLKTRKHRLESDKKKYLKNIAELKEKLKKLDSELDDNFKILKETGSLSDYETLRNEREDKIRKLEKLQNDDKLIREIRTRITEIQENLIIENRKSNNFCEKERDYFNELSNIFKEYVNYIYNESKMAGISIISNVNENKLRFNIEPKIKGENSEGINKVKIFCMDLIILVMQKNHYIKFIYHDSSIFNGVDARQKTRMLKLAKKICDKYDVQYIVNLNYDTFKEIKEHAELDKCDNDDFINYLNERIVINLYDDIPEHKLLGTDFE